MSFLPGIFKSKAISNLRDRIEDLSNEIEERVENNLDKIGDGLRELNENVKDTVEDIEVSIKRMDEAIASRLGIDLPPAIRELSRGGFINVLPGNREAARIDGHFIGADGQTFAPGTTLNEVPAVVPFGGVKNNETVIHVNGADTNRAHASGELQWIANATGSRTIGVFNATQPGTNSENFLFKGVTDFIQSANDRLDIGRNLAVDTLAETVYNELKAGRTVHITGYSQGAIITSRALQDVRMRLRVDDRMSEDEAEQLLSNVKVETFGGAAAHYPDGPQYVHYVNRRDEVPQLFGLTSFFEGTVITDPGRGAVVHYFRAKGERGPHALSTYMQEHVPFEQARRGEF